MTVATHARLEPLRLKAHGLNFHAVAAGPPDGPLVLMLHGFPEGGFAWRHQMGPRAEAGLRVVAPDLRGYGFSDKPEGRVAYTLDTLAGDVLGLADALAGDRRSRRFHVVGHDWGGVLAWHLAASAPERLNRVAILNAPHPDTLGPHALAHPLQALRSSYVGLFQLPWLPEALLAAGNFSALTTSLRTSARPGTFADSELESYREGWRQPGALRGMLAWYRALPLQATTAARRPTRRIKVPVQVIWGDRDPFLDAGLAERGAACCDGPVEVLHLPQAGHWLHHEEQEAVSLALVAFLTGT